MGCTFNCRAGHCQNYSILRKTSCCSSRRLEKQRIDFASDDEVCRTNALLVLQLTHLAESRYVEEAIACVTAKIMWLHESLHHHSFPSWAHASRLQWACCTNDYCTWLKRVFRPSFTVLVIEKSPVLSIAHLVTFNNSEWQVLAEFFSQAF